MQHWLKSITPARHALEKRWYLKPFTALVVDRGCWVFKRSRVINAFSLGLLIAFVPPTPLLPLHLTLCLVLGIVFRLNLPVLFATVFISNPLTWFPQVACSIWVGAKLMGLNLMPMLHGLSHRDFRAQLHELWSRCCSEPWYWAFAPPPWATCSRNAYGAGGSSIACTGAARA